MDASPPPPPTPTPHLPQLSHLLQGHQSSPLLASSPQTKPHLNAQCLMQGGGERTFTRVNVSSRESSSSSSPPSTSPLGYPTRASVSSLVNSSPQITPSNSLVQQEKNPTTPITATTVTSASYNVHPIQLTQEKPYATLTAPPQPHEHTNHIPLHTGVDNREENKSFDDVDCAMFCRISMLYHHTETTDSNKSDECDVAAFQRIAPDTVQDTECIQRNSAFFVELKTGDSRGFDDVDTYVHRQHGEGDGVGMLNVIGSTIGNGSGVRLLQPEINETGDSRGFDDVDTYMHRQDGQGDGVGMPNVIGSTIGNGSGVRLVQSETDAYLTGKSLISDGISNTYTARGIGSIINYSMSDIHHMNTNNQMLQNLAGRSCNDIIVANIESSVSYPRLNSSTTVTLSSVHRELPNQLLIRDGLRSSHSEIMNPTTSSQSCRSGIDSGCLVTTGSAIKPSYGPLESDSCNDSSSHQNELELEHAGNVPHEYYISDTTDNNELSQRSSSLGDTDVNDITADVQPPEVRELLNSCMDHPNLRASWTRSSPDLMAKVDKQQPASKCKTFKAYAEAALAAFSAVLFVVDIVTDFRLARMYHYDGDYTLFYVTLVFIIVPSILMSIVDISWIFLDRKSSSYQDDNRVWIAARWVFGLLSFGRVIRVCSFIRHHVKSLRKEEKAEWHRKRALEEKRDYHMLGIINAFAECAPQLLVQLYLMCKFSLDLFVLERFVSLLFSWLCIAWTYANYYRCHRKALPNKHDVTRLGFAVLFVSCLPSLAVRFICFALFMTYFDLCIPGVLLGSHIVLMFTIITCQKPSFIGTATSTLSRILYSVFFAYVSLFSFVNLRNDRSRVRMTVFYVLFYVENFIMAALVVCSLGFVEYQTVDSQTHRQLCLIMVPVCTILHIALLSLYYSVLHPTIGRLRKQCRR